MLNQKIQITFFAHATTHDNEAGIATGQNNISISPLGKQQIKKLRKIISDKIYDICFCSDLTRSIETARGIFGKKIEIKVDKRLREIDIGEFTGEKDKYVDNIAFEHIDIPYPGGESYRDVQNRMSDFLNFLKEKFQGKKVAIVAHQANQLVLEVLLKGETWKRALAEDWRKKKAWQPGWEYILEMEVI